MSRIVNWSIPLFVILAGLALFVRYGPARDIPAGTGYAAYELCSRTFVSGQPFEQVRDRYVVPKVRQLPSVWEVTRRDDSMTVATDLPGLAYPRKALYRRGLGCTMVPPGTPARALAKQVARTITPPPPSTAPWPAGEGDAEGSLVPAAYGPILERHSDIIFDRQRDAHTNTSALLVAADGHLVYEAYGEGMSREQPQLGWSMTKTITALLAGILQGDGRLDVHDPVGLPSWEGTDKAAITWQHLLTMSSGLTWQERQGGNSQATQMLFSRVDGGAYAAEQRLAVAPGTTFNYATGNSSIAMLRMRQMLGGTPQAIYDFYQRRLFAPLHIRNGVIELDASGTPVGGARGLLRPVDFLRVGQLIAQGGRFEQAQLVPADFIEFMKAPSAAEAGYGGSLWRRENHSVLPEHRARLPEDFVAMAGYQGQLLLMVPSRNLLVLRMGVAFEQQPTQERVYALLLDLLESESESASKSSPADRGRPQEASAAAADAGAASANP